jgi:arylsulfatase A-like enzyme
MDRSSVSEQVQQSGQQRRDASGAVLGVAATAGWILHDLSVFLSAGDPAVPRALAVPWLAALFVGAVLGWAIVRRRALLSVTLALGLVAALSLPVRLPLSPAGVQGVRALFVWTLGLALASRFAPRARLTASLALGALACGLHAAPMGLTAPSWRVLGAAALVLALSFVPANLARRALTVLAVLIPLVPALLAVRGAVALRRPDLAAPSMAAAPAPNLVLVVLDTVRADRLGCYGHERDTTPRLDTFAEAHATRFTNARSSSSWTLPSHATLLTGLFPAEHGATHPRAGRDEATMAPAWPAQPLREDAETVAMQLHARGWQTAAVVSNPLYLRHEFGLDRGFERYDDREASLLWRYSALPQIFGFHVWVGRRGYRDARTITDLALRWLERERRGGPFFLMLNYMEAHAPYLPEAPFDRVFGPEHPEDPLRPEEHLEELLYDRELAALDDQVGRLLDGLERLDLFDGTTVVITSDHGEAFGEHGFRKHDWTVFDEVVLVPLLVKPAGERAAASDDTHVTGADVHALMLASAGLESARRESPVTSEWYQVDEPEVWERRLGVDLERDLVCWIEEGVKVVVSTTDSVEAYDLAADPSESHPLPLTDEQRAAALQRAKAWWAANPPPAHKTEPLDAGALERLRQLGYADGQELED